jgi:hypothetical protein
MRQSRRTPITRQAVERGRESKATDFEDAEFLTIDLEVRSRGSLAPLVAAWPLCYQPVIAEGRVDPRWLILNTQRPNAEAAAKELLNEIGNLKGAARMAWKQAHRRVYDIGIRAGGGGPGGTAVTVGGWH